MKKSMTVYSCDYCDVAQRYEDYVEAPRLPEGWLKIGSHYICAHHRTVVTYRAGNFYHVEVSPLAAEEEDL